MRRCLFILCVLVVYAAPAWAVSAVWREPGSDATQDMTTFWTSLVQTNGTITSDCTTGHTGPCSIKSDVTILSGIARARRAGVLDDAGRRTSAWVNFSTIAPSTATTFGNLRTSADAATVAGVRLLTTGKIAIAPTGVAVVNGSTTLTAGYWHHVCISYKVTNSTTFDFLLYLDGVLEATSHNTGTLTSTGTELMSWGLNAGAVMSMQIDDEYIDNGSDLSDCGDVRVTAKRPFANGTTNGFTTQIGAGGSGYGSGHAPQVNERPLSGTNGWSMIVAGAPVTEEYTVEGRAVGDFPIPAKASIVDVAGWVYAKTLSAETASIIVDGTASNIDLTTTTTLFTTSSATPTAYPTNTGADIGITTTALVTTVSLYEAGILVTFTLRPNGGLLLRGIGH